MCISKKLFLIPTHLCSPCFIQASSDKIAVLISIPDDGIYSSVAKQKKYVIAQGSPSAAAAAAGGDGRGGLNASVQMPLVPVQKQQPYQQQQQGMRVRAFRGFDCDGELTGLPDPKRRRMANNTAKAAAAAAAAGGAGAGAATRRAGAATGWAAGAAVGGAAAGAGGGGPATLTATAKQLTAGSPSSQCRDAPGGKLRWSLLYVQGFLRFGDLISKDRIYIPRRVAWGCFRPPLDPASREMTLQIRVHRRDLARLPTASAAVASWAAAKGAGGGAVAGAQAPVRGLAKEAGGPAAAGVAPVGEMGKVAPLGALVRVPTGEVLPGQEGADLVRVSAATGGVGAGVGAAAGTRAVASEAQAVTVAGEVRLKGLGGKAAAELGPEAAGRRDMALGKEIAAAEEGEDASPGVGPGLQDNGIKQPPAADSAEGAVLVAEIAGCLTYGKRISQVRTVKQLHLYRVASELCGFEDWQLHRIDVVRTGNVSGERDREKGLFPMPGIRSHCRSASLRNGAATATC